MPKIYRYLIETDPTSADPLNAYNRARAWMMKSGFSVGIRATGVRSGIVAGKFTVAAWTGLSQNDKNSLDGFIEPMTPKQWSGRGVVVVMRNPLPDSILRIYHEMDGKA